MGVIDQGNADTGTAVEARKPNGSVVGSALRRGWLLFWGSIGGAWGWLRDFTKRPGVRENVFAGLLLVVPSAATALAIWTWHQVDEKQISDERRLELRVAHAQECDRFVVEFAGDMSVYIEQCEWIMLEIAELDLLLGSTAREAPDGRTSAEIRAEINEMMRDLRQHPNDIGLSMRARSLFGSGGPRRMQDLLEILRTMNQVSTKPNVLATQWNAFTDRLEALKDPRELIEFQGACKYVGVDDGVLFPPQGPVPDPDDHARALIQGCKAIALLRLGDVIDEMNREVERLKQQAFE